MTKEKKSKFSHTLGKIVQLNFHTLQGRITIGFLAVGLIASIMLWVNNQTWADFTNQGKYIIKVTSPTKVHAQKLLQSVDLTNILCFRYMSSKDDFYQKDIQNNWDSVVQKEIDTLKVLSDNWKTKDAAVYFQQIMQQIPVIRSAQKELLSSDDINKLNDKDYIDKMIHLTFLVNQLEKEQQKQEAKFQERSDFLKAWMPWILAGEYLLAFILSVIIASIIIVTVLRRIRFLRNEIRKMAQGELPEALKHSRDELNSIIQALNDLIANLRSITVFAKEVGEGHFDSDISVFNNQGELGHSLAEMRDSLQNVAEEDRKRVWFNEGVAQFGDILRQNNDNLKDLSYEIISQIIKYLKMNQGSIFLVNDTEQKPYLELMASYAYNRRKYQDKRVEIGQGLVGQCYLEQDIIYLKEIPKSYVNITSGLGDATPRVLIIVPMKVNDEVIGVFELASFHELEEYQINFLQRVAENVASSIKSVQINTETKQLLEESQMKAEQLQAQEEEMRQNAEELEATQEQLSRQNEEVQEFNQAVNQSSIIIELDNQGIITNVNQKFTQALGYTEDEIIGQPTKALLPPGQYEKEVASLQEMLKRLQSGEHFVADVERLKKNGETMWLRANFMSILDNNGRLKKISMICFDVTDDIMRQQKMEKEIETLKNKA